MNTADGFDLLIKAITSSPAFQSAASNLQLVALFLTVMILLVVFYHHKDFQRW